MTTPDDDSVKYNLGREIPRDTGHGKQWIVRVRGCHEQYWPSIIINTPYDEGAEELAKAAVYGWNRVHEIKLLR